MTGTKYASAVEYRSALSVRRPGRRTSILMIDAEYGFDFGPRPSVIGNRYLLVRRAVASVLCRLCSLRFHFLQQCSKSALCEHCSHLFTERSMQTWPQETGEMRTESCVNPKIAWFTTAVLTSLSFMGRYCARHDVLDARACGQWGWRCVRVCWPTIDFGRLPDWLSLGWGFYIGCCAWCDRFRSRFHLVPVMTANGSWIKGNYLHHFGAHQCCEKIFMRIPWKSGENPHKIPHSNEISPLWGKVGFIAFLLTNLLDLAINMSKSMKPGQFKKKNQFHTYLN